ncbi:pentapeptide repeat-containing protein [Francisella philomiragia]|uniref:Pentapeptide repeat-containing protein n=1 Tax=Francisella philomiragia TaxID=28110 RepID=A0ABS1GF11_9GAMM|nr:pentapeptide repeat-containing protein [Francisella philomiragia]MBK2259566.1 pentapeptide repeat-containing protein [Francisella philomiragia]MBK2303258.1 pentapeptide repeat-containing protein [Francisella philomiragia]
MSDDKKKKRPLDDYCASIPSIQEIDHQGEYGAEPPLYNVPLGPDMVDELLEYPVELCSINNFVYDKLWTKPAYDLLLDKVKKLNKDWQDKTIDTIDHQDTDFTNLNAQDCAIVSNKYTGANFANAKFTKTKIHGGEFKSCQFENNSFTNAEIGQAKFDNCTFTNVEFDGTDVKDVEFKNCTFSKCSFLGTQLHTSDFYDCNILECIFNSEMWYKGNIFDTKISKSEFNKSQFSGILIDSVTLVDSSLLKATFFASQIQNSDFSNNAWLKVGFAHGNSIYKSTLYNENIQQCNFSDSEWMANEVQNSQTLRNDFSAVEMHDSDFVGLKGAGDNFATGVLANCKFMDCDFAQANFTATDFIVNSSIQNCILEKLIYAYAMLPKDFDENQLKKTSQAQIKSLDDKDVKFGYPSTKAEINTPKATVAGVSNGYRYYGTMSLSGDMTVTDTQSPISNVTLEQKKLSIENSVSEEIQKWIHNDYGKAPKDQSNDNAAIVDVVTNINSKDSTIQLCWKFGEYALSPNIFTVDDKGNIYVEGTITKSNEDIVIDKRFISSSSLAIDFAISFIRDGKEAEAKQESFLHELAVGLKYTLLITGTVITFIPHPIAKGVGLGMKGTAWAMSKVGV